MVAVCLGQLIDKLDHVMRFLGENLFEVVLDCACTFEFIDSDSFVLPDPYYPIARLSIG